MGRLRQMRAQTVGMRRDEELDLPSGNHFKQASLPPKVASQVAELGLTRVAGNIFISHSTKDFWDVKNGKVVRLTTVEVDNDEHVAAPTGDPSDFLTDALNDLTF
jgi:hypothetical protein